VAKWNQGLNARPVEKRIEDDDVRVFHRTWSRNAKSILKTGFEDRKGSHFTRTERTGVFVSAVPLDSNEGADGDVLLSIEVPINVLNEYCWNESGKLYREYLVPAEILNAYRPIWIDDAELTLIGIGAERWKALIQRLEESEQSEKAKQVRELRTFLRRFAPKLEEGLRIVPDVQTRFVKSKPRKPGKK
jgi:hypothetical protein